jgi:uncharacterized protein YcbX
VPTTIAVVAGLSVYPVKSMAGSAIQKAYVGLNGILGDRRYSFVRAEQASRNSFPWMTVRECTDMLLYKPEFAHPPSPDQQEPPVRVRTPEGGVLDVSDPVLCEQLGRKLGHAVFLLNSATGIFDAQHLSLFSLASLRGLVEEAGCAIDRRQFRANLYLEPVSGEAYEEETWTGCILQIGDEAIVGVTKRDTRCMMVNVDPDNAKQNSQVLKAVVRSHNGQAGLYGNVVRRGWIREGDPVRLVSKY